tara:strand:+ start:282 stop:1547 length:1266 start_codon:yes stop_codon:yes gene_type:complete
MSLLESIKYFDIKSASKLVSIKSAGILSSIAITLILVRELEPKNVGIYFLVLAIAKVSSIIFSLGSFAAIIPIYSSSNKEDAKYLVSLAISSSFWMALINILVVNLIFILLPDSTQSRFWYVPVATFLSALTIMQTNLFHIFSVKSMLTEATIFQEGTGRNILICLIFIFILIFDSSLLGLRSIFFAIIFASFLLVSYGLTRFYFSFNLFLIPIKIVKKYLVLSLNFFPSTALLYGTSHIFDILINYLFGPISLAIIAIANRVCELLLFFTHLINLYFVRASKIYFDGSRETLKSIFKRCILVSLFTVLVLTILYLLFGHDFAYIFLKLSEYEYSELAIFLMLISTISQSITIFSQNFLTNIGRFKFLMILDFFILVFGVLLLFLASSYQLAIIPVVIIIFLRLIRQISCFFFASNIILRD